MSLTIENHQAVDLLVDAHMLRDLAYQLLQQVPQPERNMLIDRAYRRAQIAIQVRNKTAQEQSDGRQTDVHDAGTGSPGEA